MRLFTVIVFVALAPMAHAEPVLLQTIELTPVLPSIPATKTLRFNVDGADLSAIYTDSDLGATVWTIAPSELAAMNFVMHSPNPHGPRYFLLEVGNHFTDGVVADYQGIPINLNGTLPTRSGGTPAVFTANAFAKPNFKVTAVEMSLSPWTSTPGGWTATQKVEMYGFTTIPEPATWPLLTLGVVLAPRVTRRHAAGFVGRNGVAP
jgi:hypothetical protein